MQECRRWGRSTVPLPTAALVLEKVQPAVWTQHYCLSKCVHTFASILPAHSHPHSDHIDLLCIQEIYGP